MVKNIVLIGMPGCGKSTCGVLAAKALCKSFVDTDLVIQSRESMSLQAIIDQNGPDYFAASQEAALLSLPLKESSTVIATGGSAVYSEKAMSLFRKETKIIYLSISLDTMLHRIRNITTRGILLKPGETIEDMFHAREELYLRYAHSVLITDSLSVEETVSLICKAAKESE